VKLAALDVDNQKRADIAARYDRALGSSGLVLPKRRPNTSHVFHLYVLRSAKRDALIESLKQAEIGALIHYPVPVHRQKAYLGRIRGGESLPETERAALEVLSLPMYPELTNDEVDRVVSAVQRFTESA
jgi:dTDP-4-amino-4,6-dideoxygalactose transaminase